MATVGSSRGCLYALIIGVIVTFLSFVPSTGAYHDDNSQWDQEELLLWWPGFREYCAPVPSMSRMELIEPDDFIKVPGKDKCSENEYMGHLMLSVLPALIMAALILVCCPLFGIVVCVAAAIPSGRSDPDRVKKKRQSAALHCPSFGLGLLLLAVVICGSTSLVGSDRLNKFAWEAGEIMIDYPQYIVNEVDGYPPIFLEGIVPSLQKLKYSNDAVSKQTLEVESKIAHRFKERGEENLVNKLTDLRLAQEAAVGLTYAALVLVVVGGLAGAAFGMPRVSLIMAPLLWLLCAVVWIDLGVFWMGNNSVHDLCDVINGCHFCLVGLDGNKNCTKECNYPFFQSMDTCPESAANMFSGLYNLTSNGLLLSTNATCGNLTNLCDPTKTPEVQACTSVEACSTNSLASKGVVAMVLLKNQTEYQSVQALATGSSDVARQAQVILNETDVLQSYSTVMESVETLNCSTGASYIGQWYQGFDGLQRHFCPRLAEPQFTFVDMITLTSAGFLLLGLLIPFGVCCLTAHGLSRFEGLVRRPGTEPDDYLLLNPSDADEPNMLSGVASLAWEK